MTGVQTCALPICGIDRTSVRDSQRERSDLGQTGPVDADPVHPARFVHRGRAVRENNLASIGQEAGPFVTEVRLRQHRMLIAAVGIHHPDLSQTGILHQYTQFATAGTRQYRLDQRQRH